MEAYTVNPSIDWHSFEMICKKRGDTTDKAFQDLADELFRRANGIKEGLNEKYNLKYLETEPFERKNEKSVGYQAKYYEAPSIDSKRQRELLDTIIGAWETFEINEIYFYLNRELSSSSIKGQYKTQALKDIEKYAAEKKISINWITPSKLKIILNKVENSDLLEHYFGQYSVYAALKKVKQKSQESFRVNKDYLQALTPARLKPVKFTVNYKLLEESDFPMVQQIKKDVDTGDLIQSSIESPQMVSLFDLFSNNLTNNDLSRHLYISGTSGSGKTTCLLGLWKKYLDSNEDIIPIYVPIYEVNNSIKEYIIETYFKYGSSKLSFDDLKESMSLNPFHVLILLDGYNEKKGFDTFNSEIKDLFNINNVTVIVTSRNMEEPFTGGVTKLKMCELTSGQINKFLGGKKEFLPNVKYKGFLNNPFMLQKCIIAFQGETLKNIDQIPMEGILHKYFEKQTHRMSEEGKTYLNYILPLVSMKLDERKIDKEEIPSLEFSKPLCTDEKMNDSKEIHEDPKFYNWPVFWKACDYIRNKLLNAAKSHNTDESMFISIIKTKYLKEDFADELLQIGKKIDIFSYNSYSDNKVIWEHEIYRDYLVARGYALYSAYHKDSEGCIYRLARQVNFRFPEEDNKKPNVNPIIREYNSRKAQMFIDMVDTPLDDKSDINTDFLKEMKDTPVYRRLTRDVALIYRTQGLSIMGAAAELSLKYYKADNLLLHNSIYDYRDPDQRKADVAYSLSGLGYACVNKNNPTDKRDHYLKVAADALNRAENIFNELRESDSSIGKSMTVRNDSLRCRGNKAAYNFSIAPEIKNKDKKEFERLIMEARSYHLSNLYERIKLRDAIIESGKEPDGIDNDIAESMTGIATSYFHLERYRDAIKFNKAAIAFRSKGSFLRTFYNYRNIVGCYTSMAQRDDKTVSIALDYIRIMLEYANKHKIIANANEIGKIKAYLEGLSDAQKSSFNTLITSIETEIDEFSKTNINRKDS
ncbi:NACHT domain-containing protein [Ruminobacter amylophilus]|uniref:NACHT domain-containing protein n=1 Tax=Ruminobacter amylophilus TaxID=867 RepID=UPI0038688A77